MSGTAFKLVGGHLALDLVNTVEWRLDRTRAIDDLTGYDVLLRWALQTTVLDTETATRLDQMATAQPRKAAAEHRRVLQLRETAYAALVEQSGDAVAELAAYHRDALAHAVLAPSQTVWAWTEEPVALRTPADRLARATVELLTSSHLTLLGQCQDDACGWVFLDTSPRRNRRWCSATDCGTRNRARRYYAQHKAT